MKQNTPTDMIFSVAQCNELKIIFRIQDVFFSFCYAIIKVHKETDGCSLTYLSLWMCPGLLCEFALQKFVPANHMRAQTDMINTAFNQREVRLVVQTYSLILIVLT